MRRLKKPVAVVILLASASISQLPAQSVRPDPALQQPASGRASYDPMVRGKGSSGQPKGIVETTVAGVNPHNTDYGAVVEDCRKEIFENTLHEFYFWALIGMTAVIGTSLMANGWLLRERERRLAITADIVAQLYNAYVTARARVFTVIGKHNQLVEKYNLLDEEAAEMRARAAKEAAEKTNSSTSEITYEVAKKEREALGSAQTEVTDGVASGAASEDTTGMELETLCTKMAEMELQLERKTAQLQAKENQVTNLRSRLTKAHDAFEGQKRQTANHT
jgi:hypothetical protein